MVFKANIFLLTGLVATTSLFAASSKNKKQEEKVQRPSKKFYIKAETGASLPQKLEIMAPSNTWDPAVQGYDAGIGARPIIGGGLGLEFRPYFSSDLTISYRPQFKYRKYQTLPEADIDFPTSLGNKTRKFDFRCYQRHA